MNTSTPATNSSLPEDLLAVYFSQIKSISTASFAINIILGLPINVYILWLIVTEVGTEAGGTMASELFFLNLAVTEVLFCLSAIFYFIRLHNPSIIVMQLMLFSHGFLFSGRPLFQSCICVERYLAVVHPVVFLKYKPLRYRVGCCSVVWLMVLGSCLLFMLVNERSVIFYVYWGEVLMLFLLKLFCCLSVLRALKRPGPGEGEREGRNDLKMRAFRIILIIMVTMLVNYLPYEVFILFKGCLTVGDFHLGSNICFTINVITGLVQPLLYLHRVGKLPCITLSKRN